MHGCIATSVLVVNAEVDSMGGVGIDNKTSPHRAAIEKVQAELRQECGVRDERKRELEFLEKGGNPLDFKLRFVSSVSVQSTSIADPHPDRFVTSEAKGSFAFTASPHGDSVESSGRPGTAPWEPNSADNLMLFDAEHEFSEGGRNMLRRSNVGPSDEALQMDRGRKTLEHGDSAAFCIPRKAYKRRYRSRPNRDGARSSSTDINPAHGCHVSSLPSRHGTRDVKGVPDAENQNKPKIITNDILPKTIATNGQDKIELDGSKSHLSTKDKTQGVSIDTVPDAIGSENPLDEQLNRPIGTEQLNQLSVKLAVDTPKQMGSNGPEAFQIQEMKSAAVECQPSVTAKKIENSCQTNGFSRQMGNDVVTDGPNTNAFRGTKVLNSESSGAQTSLSIDDNDDGEMCTRVRNIDFNGNLKNQISQDEAPVIESGKFAIEKKDTEVIDSCTLVDKESASACQSQRDNSIALLPEYSFDQMESALENKVNNQIINEGMKATGPTQLSGRKLADPSVDNPGAKNETFSDIRHKDSVDVSISDLPEVGILSRVSTVSAEALTSCAPDPKLESKIDEDSILKEAQIIEAKRKRIAELSLVTSPAEICGKSHWDFVLEEMAWMANDFAQERIWKVAAASQISHRVAVSCLLRKKEKKSGVNAKRVAHTLAKAVLDFWHSIESLGQETGKELEQQHQKNGAFSVRAYAVRFLKFNKPNISHNQAAGPLTPDRMSDSGISDLTWEDSLTEENLFYTIPPGAMVTYRMAIESHVAQLERTGSEEVETSACDAAAGYQDYAYDEDEGETNTYNMAVGFEGSISSGYGQKKRKHLTHAYGARSYEMGSDLFPMHFADSKVVTPQSALIAKRPGSNLNVSIPTKRVRTASRRIISPFGVGASGYIQVPNKTDASSCDTSSFQDDQATLRGGLSVPNNLEVDSAGEYEKQLPFDPAEVSMRPKKKKKAKHPNAAYEERWQGDSSFYNEQFQRDHLQKRLEGHQLESNGNSGLLGQPIAKKPKLMRQHDDSFEYIPPNGGPVPSPVGSQISNMSNPNKFIKMLGGRDRGRKAKAHKMPAGQPGSGIPWSLFEDQALVVLAHDLGPNWELVSDAFNSTLQFKCIFRKAKECKERHLILMDKTSGDGADSADDSGSSQPHRSTLPGIPKGSARQLFQRLQGPMEEETLKSHFEKIIIIGKKQHCRKTQDPKQFQQPHSSHTIALSQICPNNLNGGPILTPLDLCDASIPVPDIPPLGYQGAHSGGLAIPNQGPVTQMLPPSGASSALPGSANMMIGNSFSSSPGSLNSSSRSGSLPVDEHQRMHVYNQMIPGRNIPQPNITAPGAPPGTDRGVRMHPSGNGMGVLPGVNRSMPMARPGFQGHVNSGSVAPPGMSSPNMHAAVGAAQGSSMVRPPMMRPVPNQGSPRQTVVPDLQMATNSQGMSHFVPLHRQPSHPMSPQQPQVLSPHHHQPHFQGSANHASNPQQQAYAMRLAKERQLHQRFLQQQQYAASNPLMPHVQSQSQLPKSSPMPNSSQVQPQTSSPPVSLPPLTSPPVNTLPAHQQKHQTAAQGVARKRQLGLVSQANRQHPQQRQAQQPAKVVKGVGRGNPLMHPNVPNDVSLPNGTNPGNQSLEKAEAASNSIPSKSPYAGPPQNSVQPARPFMASQSNQTLPQQKIYSGKESSSKQLQQTSQCDNSSQGRQSSPSFTGSNNQAPSNQKLVTQNQSAPQRLVQTNRHINLVPSTKHQGKDSDADQHPASSSTEMDTTKLPQASNNASNAAQVVPQPSAHKWPASEHSDTNASLVPMPSNSSDSVPHTGQGPGSRPMTSIPQSRGDVSARWQQQQQSQVPQPQKQGHLPQAGSGNLHVMPNETRLE